jgi:hypothetical protein
MKELSKKTKKFFRKNTTSETTKLIPIVKDISRIMHEFYEFFEILFEEDETIQKPEKNELLKLLKQLLKQITADKLLVFLNKAPINEIYKRWERYVCPPESKRNPKVGYPQCLVYKYPIKPGDIKSDSFINGCGLNALAFLGILTPAEAMVEMEKKAMKMYREDFRDQEQYTITKEIIKYIKTKTKIKNKLVYNNFLLDFPEDKKRPPKQLALWSALLTLTIIDLTLDEASKKYKGQEITFLAYQRFFKDFAGHTVVFNYSNYTLWMYDPQMLKSKIEVLSKKGVNAFNYRSYGGLVLVVPNPRKGKKTKKSKK